MPIDNLAHPLEHDGVVGLSDTFSRVDEVPQKGDARIRIGRCDACLEPTWIGVDVGNDDCWLDGLSSG